jgi:hypothetical protein
MGGLGDTLGSPWPPLAMRPCKSRSTEEAISQNRVREKNRKARFALDPILRAFTRDSLHGRISWGIQRGDSHKKTTKFALWEANPWVAVRPATGWPPAGHNLVELGLTDTILDLARPPMTPCTRDSLVWNQRRNHGKRGNVETLSSFYRYDLKCVISQSKPLKIFKALLYAL